MISVYLSGGAVDVRTEPVPERPEGYALIRLLIGGICNTDLELQRGYYGFAGIPGHEFVGEAVAADDRNWLGRRVVGEINLACHKCAWCNRRLERHCPNRTVLGIVRQPGAFREFLTLPERNLHALPDSVSTESAVFTEPLAAACEILDQIDIPQGGKVAVMGDGKLGLLIAQVLQASGCRVHQFGKHPAKLRIAEKAGVTISLIDRDMPVAEYQWVVDATGSASGLAAAVSMVQPRGTVVLKSTVHGKVPVDTAPIIVNEITLMGSRCGRFEPALQFLESGRIDVTSLISETFPLAEAKRAFEHASASGVLKVLLRG